LLKPKTGGDYEFVRQGKAVGGEDVYTAFFNGATGTAYFTQSAFSSTTDSTQRTVIHELAHAWDEPRENSFVTRFRALSGWTDKSPAANELDRYELNDSKDFWYLKNAGFVSGYAKTNPREDFAKTVEAYFAVKFGLRHGFKIDDTTASKLQLIEDWVDDLSTSTSSVVGNPRQLTYRPTGRVFGGWGR